MPSNRRKARELVLQCQYALEMSSNTLQEIIVDQIMEKQHQAEVTAFAENLLKEAHLHKEKIDEFIIKHCKNWDFNRIALLDRLILRQAITEFMYFEDIPPKVTIDEAIELSKDFSTEKSGPFINGILDSVLASLKKDYKLFKSGRGLRDK